jgi:hypothetical protein
MESAERSCVFFRGPGAGLDEAEAALRDGGLGVARSGDALRVARPGGPELTIRIVRGEGARRDAARLGRGEPVEALLRQCDAAFVITFRDLDEVLEDTDVLTDVQLRLQKLTAGVIARSWNDELSGPDGAAG